MEGIHCTYPAIDHRFNGKKFVRIHNVEHSYYQRLYSCSHNLLIKRTIAGRVIVCFNTKERL